MFKIKSLPAGLHIGFHAAKSHTVIDMHHCDVLTPGLFALVGALRQQLEPLFGVGEAAELHVTETETGFDCAFRWRAQLTPALTAGLVVGAVGPWHRAADHGPGDGVRDSAVPTRAPWAGSPWSCRPIPSCNPRRKARRRLQARVLEIVGKAKSVADLFAGCGTFALPLARKAKVHAVEQDEPALAALAAAAKAPGLKPVTTETPRPVQAAADPGGIERL